MDIRQEGNTTIVSPDKDTPKLDFLFVDAWMDANTTFEPAILKIGMVKIQIDGGVDFLENLQVVDEWTFTKGANSIPFVPISQTTIFVHPTTFQRYMFNGTTMVEYDDVDGVVPKWLKYEALLSQTGTDAPIARVLNQDERDYLGNFDWTYIDTGVYDAFNPTYNHLLSILSSIKTGINITDLSISGYTINNLELCISEYGSPSDGALFNTPIAIKQRVRGNPPKLVTAETNIVGDKVIITYNKKLNPSLDLSSFMNDILTSGIFIEGLPEGQSFIGIQSYLIIENSVELTLVSNIPYTLNNMRMSRNNFIIEALDFGINNDGWDIVVTNKIPAPPELLYAYTNEAGTEVILEFSKEMDITNIITYLGIDFQIQDDMTGGLVIDSDTVTKEGNNIIFDLHSPTVRGAVISSFYNHPYGAVNITSMDGGILPSFDITVENRVTA